MNDEASPRIRAILKNPIPPVLFSLAAPNVVATFTQTLSTFADAWFVGKLGTVALASLALVFPFQMLMIMMAGGAIGGGATSAVSRALGRSDTQGANAAAWHAVLIAVVMSALFTVVLGIFARPVFSLLGGTGATLDGAVAYARIAFGGAIVVWMTWVLAAVLRGTGDTTTPARVIVSTTILQIFLSGLLTTGWGLVPSLGIAGPATALVICQVLASLYMAWYLISGKAAVMLKPGPLRFAPLADIMRVGGLGLINSASIALTTIFITAYVARYGTAALAGFGLGSRLELMLVPFAFGIGGALTVAVGTNFGAEQYARGRRFAWTGAATIFTIIGVVSLFVFLKPGLWLNLFTTDPEAYRVGALYLLIVAPVFAVFAGGQTLYFASQGTGRMLLPVTVGVTRFITVAGLGALVVSLDLALAVLITVVALGLCIVGAGLALCMRSAAWCPDRAPHQRA